MLENQININLKVFAQCFSKTISDFEINNVISPHEYTTRAQLLPCELCNIRLRPKYT